MSQVTIKVNAQNNTKQAIDQAKSGLQSLGQAANAVNTIFKGFLALKAVQQISSIVSDSLQAYSVQQRAISQLTVAIRNNANLTSQSLQRLIDYTGQLQRNSVFGDEALQEQATMLAAMGLTEDQIRKTLTAATELSSAGIGTLESNVKNLGKTFGGLTGELGESIPAIKTLTKEQLMNGEAVDLIQRKYEGFAKNLALNTFDGQVKQLNNSLGKLKEAIGAAFAPLASPFLTFVNTIISRWTEAIAKMTRYQELSRKGEKATAQEQLEKRQLELERVKADKATDLKAVGYGSYDDWIKQMRATGLHQYQYNSVTPAGRATQDRAWQNEFNKLVDAYKQGAVQKEFQNKIDRITAEMVELQKVLDKQEEVELKSIEETKKAAEKQVEASDLLKERIDALRKAEQDAYDYKIESDKHYERKLRIQAEERALMEEEAKTNNTSTQPIGISAIVSNSSGLFGDTLAPILDILKSFGSGLSDAILHLSSVTQLINPLQTILSGMMEVLSPLINSLLAPLVGGLKIVGMLLGSLLKPQLELLGKVITILMTGFVWLYNNALRPLANAIIFVQVQISNLFIDAYNAIRKLLKNIGVSIPKADRVSYNDSKIDKISLSDLTAAGTSSTGSTGGSASYSGPQQVINNFYIYDSYLNTSREAIWRDISVGIRGLEATGNL